MARGLVTSASYSITVRLAADGDPASVGRIATAVGSAGGAVTAIDVVESRPDGLTIEVYRDRPRSEWLVSPAGEILSATEPLQEAQQ